MEEKTLTKRIVDVISEAVPFVVVKKLAQKENVNLDTAHALLTDKIVDAVKIRVDFDDYWLDFAAVPEGKNYTNETVWHTGVKGYEVGYEQGFIDALKVLFHKD